MLKATTLSATWKVIVEPLKAGGTRISYGSIYNILKANQMINKPYKPRRQRSFKRWQRRRPDSLWQTCIKYYGNLLGRIPRQILSDHGAQFYSEDGGSQFTAYLEAHGIEHILGSIGKPTTQGKIERFFQTFELHYPRFNDMTEFLEHYNYVRPYRSLNLLTPAEVYYS
jgi:transposase InsO family protein